jgi:hypothetical protein
MESLTTTSLLAFCHKDDELLKDFLNRNYSNSYSIDNINSYRIENIVKQMLNLSSIH